MPNMMGFIITPPATVPVAIKRVDDKLYNIESLLNLLWASHIARTSHGIIYRAMLFHPSYAYDRICLHD